MFVARARDRPATESRIARGACLSSVITAVLFARERAEERQCCSREWSTKRAI
jgi:hypothetical protein